MASMFLKGNREENRIKVLIEFFSILELFIFIITHWLFFKRFKVDENNFIKKFLSFN